MKMWYIYTVEQYSSIKKGEIMNFAGKQIELEKIIFKSGNQDPKRLKCSPTGGF